MVDYLDQGCMLYCYIASNEESQKDNGVECGDYRLLMETFLWHLIPSDRSGDPKHTLLKHTPKRDRRVTRGSVVGPDTGEGKQP